MRDPVATPDCVVDLRQRLFEREKQCHPTERGRLVIEALVTVRLFCCASDVRALPAVTEWVDTGRDVHHYSGLFGGRRAVTLLGGVTDVQ